MPQQSNYTPMAMQVFNQYLDQQLDLDALLEKLREMELQLMADEEDAEEETEKNLWFRFFEGDTEKTTIADIARDLQNPGHPGGAILLRAIAFSLSSQELQVHYS